jgi:hypothetical protein
VQPDGHTQAVLTLPATEVAKPWQQAA